MATKVKVLAMDQISDAAEKLLYSPATSFPPQAAVVRAMRFTNLSGIEAKLNLYLVPNGGSYANDKRFLFPKDLKLAPGEAAVDNQELTLGSGDKIYAAADASGANPPWFECVISGVERDV